LASRRAAFTDLLIARLITPVIEVQALAGSPSMAC